MIVTDGELESSSRVPFDNVLGLETMENAQVYQR